jgi:hypothetical protein
MFSFWQKTIAVSFKALFIALPLLLVSDLFSQTLISQINLQKIPPKVKKKFVHSRYIQNIETLNELYPSCYNTDDSSLYRFQKETFIIKEDINKVWKTYKTLNINDTYSGHIVDFGFIYSKNEQSIIYLDDTKYEGMKEGQVIFISLSLLGGVKKLIVAYEVINIDEENKSIKFCYINNGISTGSQEIRLYKSDNGFTRVTHNTLFKSNSKLRDITVYPFFHKKIVKELHSNLIHSIKSI